MRSRHRNSIDRFAGAAALAGTALACITAGKVGTSPSPGQIAPDEPWVVYH